MSPMLSDERAKDLYLRRHMMARRVIEEIENMSQFNVMELNTGRLDEIVTMLL